MDKIRIAKVMQGNRKLDTGTFAIGLRTKWGTLWITKDKLSAFLAHNPHLKDIFKGPLLNADDLVGRYINIKNKAQEQQHLNGYTTTVPTI